MSCRVVLGAVFMLVLLLRAGAEEPKLKEAQGSSRRTLLVLVTLKGNEHLQGFFIDPELAKSLRKHGWKIEGRGIEEARREHFDAADAVVLLQEPYAANLGGVAAFQKLAPEVDAYLKRGGGLLVIFDDRYFQVFGPLNEFLKPYGAEFLREAVLDGNQGNVSRLEQDDEISLFRTRSIHSAHPATAGINEMSFPQTEGGKLSFPLKVTDDWTPLVRAEKTARSCDIWAADRRSSYAEEPILVAAREVGTGRMIAFGAHSSLSFLHGSHPRWDDGYFLKKGMRDFFVQALDWLEQAPAVAEGKRMPSLEGDPAPRTQLHPVPESQQGPVDHWQSGALVLLDAAPASLKPWTRALTGKLQWLALALPASTIPEKEDYLRWKALCEEASKPDLLIIPAATVEDSFRNPIAVLNPKEWPVRRKARAVNHIAREIGGHPVLLSPAENPWPPENIGGFQGFALVEYEKGRLKKLNLEIFRDLQAGDWFVVPEVVFSKTDPQGVARIMDDRGYRTMVPSKTIADVPLKFPFLFHNERNIVVSRGAVIRQAALTGDSLVRDPWEGTYYFWRGPADQATYSIDVHQLPKGSDVRIQRGYLLWRRYEPEQVDWQHRFSFASTESLHSYWMEIWNGGELEAISSASRSRTFRNWAHGGGDRMNLYHSVVADAPDGPLAVDDRTIISFGGLYFNLGWGDTVTIGPAQMGRSPAGSEWGLPSGGIQYIRFSPRVQSFGKREFEVSKPRRIGYAMVSEDAAVLRETVDRKEEEVSGVRTVQPAKFIRAETSYTIPVWRPGGLVSMIVDTKITAEQDLNLGDSPSIQLVEFAGRSGSRFNQVTTGRASGEASTRALFDQGKPHHERNGRWYLIHPDNLGSVLLVPLDGKTYSLGAEPSSKGVRVRLRLDLDSPVLKKGDSLQARYGFAITGGTEADPIGAVSESVKAWAGRSSALQVVLESGKLVSWSGYLDFSAADTEWISGKVALSKEAAPVVLRFGGNSERLPVYGKSLTDAEELVPLGQEQGYAYQTVPTGAKGTIGIGKLFACSNPNFQVDVKSLSSEKLEAWVHNPTQEAADARLTFLLPAKKEAVRDLTLKPGEERLLVFERALP